MRGSWINTLLLLLFLLQQKYNMNIYNNNVKGQQYTQYIIYIGRNKKYNVLELTYCALLITSRYDVDRQQASHSYIENMYTYFTVVSMQYGSTFCTVLVINLSVRLYDYNLHSVIFIYTISIRLQNLFNVRLFAINFIGDKNLFFSETPF